jgi:hypothetical protein
MRAGFCITSCSVRRCPLGISLSRPHDTDAVEVVWVGGVDGVGCGEGDFGGGVGRRGFFVERIV